MPVIFVSGQKSSNGKVLYGVCREANPNSYSIEDAGELQFRWLEGCRSVEHAEPLPRPAG